MDQGSPGHKLEDNPVLSELHWDEADLDEELHKVGGGEQGHSFWELIFSVCVCVYCQAKPASVCCKIGETVNKLTHYWKTKQNKYNTTRGCLVAIQ